MRNHGEKMLKRMRELLATPSLWTQGVLARDKDGLPTGAYNENATCMCLMGAAINAHDNTKDPSDFEDLIEYHGVTGALLLAVNAIHRKKFPAAYPIAITTFNDALSRTHADVIEAIELALTYVTEGISAGESNILISLCHALGYNHRPHVKALRIKE